MTHSNKHIISQSCVIQNGMEYRSFLPPHDLPGKSSMHVHCYCMTRIEKKKHRNKQRLENKLSCFKFIIIDD